MEAGVAVIDAHTHAFSPDVLNERARVVESDFWFGSLYGNPSAKAVDAETIGRSLDESRIDAAVICGFPWSDEGRCRSENAWLAEATAADDRLSWLGIVIPDHPDAAADAAWCFDHGAVGIGELNADGQGVSLLDPAAWAPLIDVAAAYDRPLLLHASEAPGHAYPGKGCATPEKLVEWLRGAQAVDVVLAHWGGGLPFYELMPEVHALTRRVHYDSAASTYLYQWNVFPRVIDLVGRERVIFGTDFPLLKQRRFLDRTLAVLRDRDEVASVLGENAGRLYRTGAKGSAS